MDTVISAKAGVATRAWEQEKSIGPYRFRTTGKSQNLSSIPTFQTPLTNTLRRTKHSRLSSSKA
jgi:hypothetical protein